MIIKSRLDGENDGDFQTVRMQYVFQSNFNNFFNLRSYLLSRVSFSPASDPQVDKVVFNAMVVTSLSLLDVDLGLPVPARTSAVGKFFIAGQKIDSESRKSLSKFLIGLFCYFSKQFMQKFLYFFLVESDILLDCLPSVYFLDHVQSSFKRSSF